MKDKKKRFEAIRDIVGNEVVYSQEELLERLYIRGFELTQATLSRDLRSLAIVKDVTDTGKSAYKLREEITVPVINYDNGAHLLADGFISIDFSGNLCVVKTDPGYASPIAATIDNRKSDEIIGTIAGDDTIMLIMKEGIGRSDLISALISIMPKLKDRLIVS